VTPVSVDFKWQSVGKISQSELGRLVIPKVGPEPGIYRFQICDQGSIEEYIGQTQNLDHRMQKNYSSRYHGKTAVSVRAALLERLEQKLAIDFSIASDVTLTIGNKTSPADLTKQHIRMLVENTAIVPVLENGSMILNRLLGHELTMIKTVPQ
jgi:hypothetical protein